MIFFLTTLIPSSDSETDIRKFKALLFRRGVLIPMPLTLIPVSLTEELPARPERKKIAADYPGTLTPDRLIREEKTLKIDFKETLPFHSDFDRNFNSLFTPGKLYLGQITGGGTGNFHMSGSAGRDFRPFSKYSLAAYRIHAVSSQDWWKNMSWEKMWEVKKGSAINRN